MNDEKMGNITEAAIAVGEQPHLVVQTKDGRAVHIHKCKAKNLGTVLEFITFIMDQLGIKKLGEMPSIDLEDMNFMMKLLMESSDRVFHTAAALTDLSESEFVEMELDDVINICIAVVNLNKEFFVQSVLPLVRFALPENQGNQNEQESQ